MLRSYGQKQYALCKTLCKHNWTITICAVQNNIHRQQQYVPCQRAFAQKSDQSLLPKRSRLSWSRSRPLSWSIDWLRGTWRSCKSALLFSISNLKTNWSDIFVKLSYTWMNNFLFSILRNIDVLKPSALYIFQVGFLANGGHISGIARKLETMKCQCE